MLAPRAAEDTPFPRKRELVLGKAVKCRCRRGLQHQSRYMADKASPSGVLGGGFGEEMIVELVFEKDAGDGACSEVCMSRMCRFSDTA